MTMMIMKNDNVDYGDCNNDDDDDDNNLEILLVPERPDCQTRQVGQDDPKIQACQEAQEARLLPW